MFSLVSWLVRWQNQDGQCEPVLHPEIVGVRIREDGSSLECARGEVLFSRIRIENWPTE